MKTLVVSLKFWKETNEMSIKNKLIVTVFLISLLVMGVTQTAQAYTFYINEFFITKNGTPLFDDLFNDGAPPPSGGPNLISGGTLSYNVFGTMGPELNTNPNPGKLTLDSSGGLIDSNPLGRKFLEQRAILLTDTTTGGSLGLRSNSTFSATGVFDLIIPSVPLSGYGVRFTDGTPSNTTPNDVAYVLVERMSSTDVKIRFLHFDFATNTVTLLGETQLVPDSHTTISLRVTKGTLDSNAVTAFYAYDGGSFTQLPGTMDIFNGADFTRAQFIAFEPAPVSGDFDGDGKTDISVWRPGNGYWYTISSKDGSIIYQQWGGGAFNDVPVPGDYDGDGKTDIAVWRPGDGVWYIISSKDGSIRYQQWGKLGDVPVPGDYDGDGKTDIAVWRPGDGVWYIISSKDGSIIYQQWGGGAFNDVPVPGDYDGDGKTDIAVWRPGDGVWYIISSKDGSIIYQQWGSGSLNDEPISQ